MRGPRERSLRPEGYALVGWPGKRSRCTGLHRLVYCEHNGVTLESIAGKVVRHTCDNPRCIEPTHLILGTWDDNNKDRARRGRSARSVPSRQALDAYDVEVILQRRDEGSRELGRQFHVDPKVIHRIFKGAYIVG